MVLIKQLFYVSRSLAQPSDIEWILIGARTANERRGITGMLFHSGAYFAQLFEGDPYQVDATMADIVADRRHEDVRVLMERIVTRRSCGDWRMAFLEAPGADALLCDLHVAPMVSPGRIDRLLALLSRQFQAA